MKVLLCCWESMCEPGIAKAIKNLGHQLFTFDKPYTNPDFDTDYIKVLGEHIQNIGGIDCVFSINFIPIIARVCKVFNTPYISWTVDSPCITLYSDTLAYPTNYVFIFDRLLANKYYIDNPEHVFHMPLACDVSAWDNIQPNESDHALYDCDVSFVGSLYSEKSENKYNSIQANLPDYIKGYMEGLIRAQQNVYGYNFLEDSISDEWVASFKEYLNWDKTPGYKEDYSGMIADFYIGYKCTEHERISTLKAISDVFSTHLYTLSDASMIPNIINRGSADSHTMLPKIYKCSKINLNMTSRPIKSGLPLRIFDIMGAGGFLISNYQCEIPEHFVPDEDIVLYDSIPDLISKIQYYLTHDNEREQIAKNGHNKVKQYHTYELRLQEMFEIVGLI